MTFSINGIGTSLVGSRYLNEWELGHISKSKDFKEIVKGLPIKTKDDLTRFMITTKTFCIFWIPVLPLETFIYYSPKVKWHQDEEYIPLFYLDGKGRVSWEHVKRSFRFYFAPILAAIYAYFYFLG
jgi:hypothetical protein